MTERPPSDLKNGRPVPRQELIEAYLTGTSLDTLRKRYGVCIRRLWRILERRGIERRSCKAAREEQARQQRAKPLKQSVMGVSIDVLKEAYLKGQSALSLSRQYGINNNTINRHLRLHGVTTRTVGQGRHHAWALVPKEQRMEAMAKVREGKKQSL